MQGKKLTGEFWFVLILIAIFITYFISALGLRKIAAQAPLVVVVPLILFLVLQLVNILRKNAHSESSSASSPASGNGKKSLSMILMLFAFIISVYFIGMYITIFLYLILFFKFASKKSWAFSLITSVITLACVYLVFGYFFTLDLYPGQLFMYQV